MIYVWVHRAELVKLGACSEGLALFDTIAKHHKHGPSKIRLPWTTTHMVWLATAYPGFWSWARDLNVLPSLALIRADLQRANLRGANLRGANLRGADLQCADLQCANLEGANLEGANLEGANLRGANLEGANLYGAYLYGANLQRAHLRDAHLRDADLRGALSSAYTQLPEGYERTPAGLIVKKESK